MPRLAKEALESLKKVLNSVGNDDSDTLEAIVTSYYTPDTSHGTPIGGLITQRAMKSEGVFIKHSRFGEMMRVHPMFAADIGLACYRQDTIDLQKTTSYECHRRLLARYREGTGSRACRGCTER